MAQHIIKDLRDLASLCRRSAEKSEDEQTAATFLKMAEEIEADIRRMEAADGASARQVAVELE